MIYIHSNQSITPIHILNNFNFNLDIDLVFNMLNIWLMFIHILNIIENILCKYSDLKNIRHCIINNQFCNYCMHILNSFLDIYNTPIFASCDLGICSQNRLSNLCSHHLIAIITFLIRRPNTIKAIYYFAFNVKQSLAIITRQAFLTILIVALSTNAPSIKHCFPYDTS